MNKKFTKRFNRAYAGLIVNRTDEKRGNYVLKDSIKVLVYFGQNENRAPPRLAAAI